MADPCTKFEVSSVSRCGEITRGVKFYKEAPLSPRDRAMRRVNWNLANCHTTVQKLLIRQLLTKSMVWSWRFSLRQCVIDNVHSTMMRSSRLPLSRVINKPTTLSCVYHLSTDDLLWRNFLSPQCRNCSRAENGVVRGHSKSSAMSPFDSAHTTSYSTLIETMCLSCTVFKI